MHILEVIASRVRTGLLRAANFQVSQESLGGFTLKRRTLVVFLPTWHDQQGQLQDFCFQATSHPSKPYPY